MVYVIYVLKISNSMLSDLGNKLFKIVKTDTHTKNPKYIEISEAIIHIPKSVWLPLRRL